MRIWDVKPGKLCREHLLGEHRELHAIWSIITKSKKGYSQHPETLRWKGKLKALYLRHEKLVGEMEKRGYCHRSPLDKRLATGKPIQLEKIDTIEEQRNRIKRKGCKCNL
ncbi:MAG: pyrimidine dimer DNA glycosylase/endonuclease V [Candidatus Micrarchaeota archaeon]